MMTSYLLPSLFFLGFVSCNPREGIHQSQHVGTPRERISQNQHVETYWESWSQMNPDFSSKISAIPVTPLGSNTGVNVVNIAFADTGDSDRYLSKLFLINDNNCDY